MRCKVLEVLESGFYTPERILSECKDVITANCAPQDFGKALEWLKQGKKVTRRKWIRKWVISSVGEEMYLTARDGHVSNPWVASCRDMFATDWVCL